MADPSLRPWFIFWIFIKKKYFIIIIYSMYFKKISVLGKNRPNTTKYSLKRPKLRLKRPKTYTQKISTLSDLLPLLPLSTFWHFIIILYETACGTARSNTENGLHSWSSPHFCMGQDYLWDSEEQNREIHTIPFPMLLLVSQRQSRPIQKTRSRTAMQSTLF